MNIARRECRLSDDGQHLMGHKGYSQRPVLRCTYCGVREGDLRAMKDNLPYAAVKALFCEIHGTGNFVPDKTRYFETHFDTADQIAGQNAWIHLLKPGATTDWRGTIQSACGPRTYTCYVVKITSCDTDIKHITCPRCSLLAVRAISQLSHKCESKGSEMK